MNKKRKKLAKNFLSRPTSLRYPLPKGDKKKVLIALSGGIDSAVSAYLLIKQGYEVEAAFMKNWSSTKGLKYDECPWLIDRQDALRVAAFLHIPLHTLDFEKQYEKKVLNYFFKEYAAGRTPNPDVMCNKEIKFKLLYNWAMKNSFDYLATGHYARISSKNQVVSSKGKNRSSGNPLIHNTCYMLLRSNDEFKDQTYFIYNIKTEQLPHILFPVGGKKKPQVKLLAKKIGLPNTDKKESMGLCFVGRIRLKDFLEQKLKPKPGSIVDVSPLSLRGAPNVSEGRRGNLSKDKIAFDFAKATSDKSAALAMTARGDSDHVIGRHEGLHNYTIGQRQGIKVGGSSPYYVVQKDLATNTLFVTNNPNDERLFTKEIQLHSVNWIGSPPFQGGVPRVSGGRWLENVLVNSNPSVSPRRINLRDSLRSAPSLEKGRNTAVLLGRYRHQGELVPLTITQIKKDLYHVVFKKPQKAVASGQSLVLYKGKVCVGGGAIV